MSRVIVKDSNVHERPINTKNGQKIMRSQRAALDQGDGYELPFRVELGIAAAYPVGVYDIHPETFQLNQYGDLALGRMKLIPLKSPAPQPLKA